MVGVLCVVGCLTLLLPPTSWLLLTSLLLLPVVPTKMNPDAAKWAPEGQNSPQLKTTVLWSLFKKNMSMYVRDRETEAEAWNNVETKMREKM